MLWSPLLLDLLVDNVFSKCWVVLLELQLLFHPLSIAVVVTNMLALSTFELYQMIL